MDQSEIKGAAPITLTPAQNDVAEKILAMARSEDRAPRMATLVGGAGTGKTSVVSETLNRLAVTGYSGGRIVVAAPTHKALAVLREKISEWAAQTIGLDFATVHSLLGLKMVEDQDGFHRTDAGGKQKLRDYTLAIIDECSMIGDDLFAMILSTALSTTRVLFVGDSAQLPPVNAPQGQLSCSFDPERIEAQWPLTEVLRQAQENPILRIATLARHRIQSKAEMSVLDIAQRMREGDDAFMSIEAGNRYRVGTLVADAMRANLDVRALAFDNHTVLKINEIVHGIMHPGVEGFAPGEPVIAQEPFEMMGCDLDGTLIDMEAKIQVRNSESLTALLVQNNQVHPMDPAKRSARRIVLEADDGSIGAVFVPVDQSKWFQDIRHCFDQSRAARMKAYGLGQGNPQHHLLMEESAKWSMQGWATKNRYAPIRHAYALTVHKSQGSTFDASVIYWPSFDKCRDVSTRNRLAYVALTRTSKYTVIVC